MLELSPGGSLPRRLTTDQQREWVRDCLARADLSPVEPFDRFVGRIDSSIDHFLAIRPQGTLARLYQQPSQPGEVALILRGEKAAERAFPVIGS